MEDGDGGNAELGANRVVTATPSWYRARTLVTTVGVNSLLLWMATYGILQSC